MSLYSDLNMPLCTQVQEPRQEQSQQQPWRQEQHAQDGQLMPRPEQQQQQQEAHGPEQHLRLLPLQQQQQQFPLLPLQQPQQQRHQQRRTFSTEELHLLMQTGPFVGALRQLREEYHLSPEQIQQALQSDVFHHNVEQFVAGWSTT
jgi:hypothetical protein